MKNKTLWCSTLLCLSPIFLGIALYDQLPDVIATHFGVNNEPNGWSSKEMTVFGIPLFMTVLHLLGHWLMSKEPTMKTASPRILLQLTDWIIPAISLMIMPMILLTAIGKQFPMALILSFFTGLLFVVVGNYMPKCKPNPYMGIKLPWTFASEENWYKTHRFGGKVWVIAGIVTLVGGMVGQYWLLMVALTASILLPTLYSWRESKRESKT